VEAGWRGPGGAALTSPSVEQYLPILLLLVLVGLFTAGSVTASRLLGPKRPTGAKEGPYESGIVPRYRLAARFPVRFYLVAMIFIIFDIEVIFLYPWAVMYRQLATFGLAEMAAFAVVVFIAFAYLVSNGALDWGPHQRRGGPGPSKLTRSTTSTVRRVRRPEEIPFDGPAPTPLDEDAAAGDGGAQQPAASQARSA
jgi:NADH-quinone oxidoreductase subunit A